MASSVASTGASPPYGHDFKTDSSGDTDQNQWTLLHPAGSVSSNAAFSFSPASHPGSCGSYLKVNNCARQARPPLSGTFSFPNLEVDQASSLTSSNYGYMGGWYSVTSAPSKSQFIAVGQPYAQSEDNVLDPDTSKLAFNQDMGANQRFSFAEVHDLWAEPRHFPAPLCSLSRTLGAAEQQPPAYTNLLDVHQPIQSCPDVRPWTPEDLRTTLQPSTGNYPVFVKEDIGLVPPSNVRLGPGDSIGGRKPNTIPDPIIIQRTSDTAGVRKNRAPDPAPPSSAPSSASSSRSQFLVITPDSVNAYAGRASRYEFSEAMRASQKGRKSPLQDDTRQNALQVRRVGACFCCHARKVRCDKERPCRNCTRLMTPGQVPRVICWRFQDFTAVLFPDFIRAHLRRNEMARFLADNIAGFTVDGAERSCAVELSSGAAWTSTFRIEAKFFTPKTDEVQQHWHMQIGRDSVALQSRRAPPIGLETDRSGSGSLPAWQHDEIRMKVREYIASIIREPKYAEQVTDSLRHTDLPRKVLKIVQRYAQRSHQPMVDKALSIYAMHYVMTRHLCLTQQSVASLRRTGLFPQDSGGPWVTPRVLNRQIKSVVDEMLAGEVRLLFAAFSRQLKPRRRGDWAPCLAAFLVLCLFMEALETAWDTFAMSQNEIELRGGRAPQWKRPLVLEQNRVLENLPFRQFAHQFHQIYATHSSEDASAKAFNPLVDEASLQQAELDPGAAEMVFQLRQFITDKNSCRSLLRNALRT